MSFTKRIDSEVEDKRTVLLTEKDIQDVARLCQLLTGKDLGVEPPATTEVMTPPGSNSAERQGLVAAARRRLIMRRRRAEYFSRAMFGEPAWDMLLVLYIADFVGARQTISKLADWIDTPLTTAIRWAAYLEKERLIGRQPHPHDRRVVFVNLLDRGRDLMDTYLRSSGDEGGQVTGIGA